LPPVAVSASDFVGVGLFFAPGIAALLYALVKGKGGWMCGSVGVGMRASVHACVRRASRHCNHPLRLMH